jgi:hypothetical protein
VTRTERQRRVLLLCCHFSRNVAYYRAAKRGRTPRVDTPFWRTVSNNNYDLCVLEWCKLFADRRDPHHWRNVLKSAGTFDRELRGRLVLSARDFDYYVTAVRRYRNKFVAHLDSDRVMNLPRLDIATNAVAIYYERMVTGEVPKKTAASFPDDMDRFYRACRDEAAALYLFNESRDV